jgi:hypothetical protein
MQSRYLHEDLKITLSWESLNDFNVVIIYDSFIAFIYRNKNYVCPKMKKMIAV